MPRKSISVIAIAIASIYVLYFISLTTQTSYTLSGSDTGGYTFSIPEEDSAFGGIFFVPDINDSLIHYQYKHIEDSIHQITEKIKLDNRGIASSGMSFGALSVTSIEDESSGGMDFSSDRILVGLLDSLELLGHDPEIQQQIRGGTNAKKLLEEVNERRRLRYNELVYQQQAKKETLYYLGLNGYDKKEHTTEFFLDKGTNNLAYFVTDSVRKGLYSSINDGHYERKRIAIRYAADDRRVLIPLTKRQYQIAAAALKIVVYGIIFLGIYIMVGLPLQILINISKGRAFTLQNIQRFNIMAIALLIAALTSIFTPYLLRLFYRSIIPDEFILKPFLETSYNQLSSLLLALGVFLIGKAFKRGYTLQQENSLTI